MLSKEGDWQVPRETAAVAKQVFRKGHPYLHVRDRLGAIFQAEDFAQMYSQRGQPGVSPVMLALATLVQFAEGLSDRGLMVAIVGHIEVKYLLGLPLEYAGFDYSVLSEYRQRLQENQQEALLFERVLQAAQAAGLFKERGRQRTDSTHILGAVRSLNRAELVGESLRIVLNTIAGLHSQWLQERVDVAWFERYSVPIENHRLPKKESERQAWVEQVGRDGVQLLAWLAEDKSVAYLLQAPPVRLLAEVWQQQYHIAGAEVRFRRAGQLPPASEMIQSPYDPAVRYSEKRGRGWDGYKVHLTESCDPGQPHLITNVTTTAAPESDFALTHPIQEQLEQQGRAPTQHLLDGGYTSVDNILDSQALGIDLVGPVPEDQSWQAREQTGCSQQDFRIDWQAKQATCPTGQVSEKWIVYGQQQAVQVRFAAADCRGCALRQRCTTAIQAGRSLKLPRQEEYAALAAARRRQQSPEFADSYRQRAGIEGTIAQFVRLGQRSSRYIGLRKTHFQNLATAAAINLVRLGHYFAEAKSSTTRTSRFARLAPA